MIPSCLVGGASDDERDLGSGKSIDAELALHCGARREVDLLRDVEAGSAPEGGGAVSAS